MMIKRSLRNLEKTGYLFICLILVSLSAARFNPSSNQMKEGQSRTEGIYIQLGGDAPVRGTYLFDYPPVLAEIIPRFLNIKHSKDVTSRYNQSQVVSHSLIEIIKNDTVWEISCKEIPGHQKLTLGIPISVNLENEEGLTAIPGIGTETAKILIRERQKRGGFKNIDELKSLPGIGKGVFRKIQPFITL